jgi:flagellar biosynthesis protein FlhF
MTKGSQMRIKSYFAKSVDHAITQAREELGVEAMLLNTRKLAAGQPEGPGYEVVFGLADEAPGPVEETVAAAATPAIVEEPVETAPPTPLASELERLHAQMDELQSLIARSSRAQQMNRRSLPELAEIHAHLIAEGVEAALSTDIVNRLEASLGSLTSTRGDSTILETALRRELESRVGLAPRLGTGSDDQGGPVVVLVGPRGAGKTTTLAKLAVSRAQFTKARPAKLLSLDMSRPAAHVQLQSVARTFGIGFQEVPAAYLLPGLIAETRQKETIFVDTPGYTSMDGNAAEAAAAAFAECPQLDIHLVVPGYMKARDLRLCIQKYAIFRPTKLLVTKLDETGSLGSIFSEAARAGLQLSFVTYGPAIPRDLRAAISEDLLTMAIENNRARVQSVA